MIRIDEERCNGCGQCVTACAENAIRLINGKARLVSEKYCDELGACLGEYPTGALTIVEEAAEAFEGPAPKAAPAPVHHGGPACPSARAKTLTPRPGTAPDEGAPMVSALSHWPVQIRLVPPAAPFLHRADLLVAADCVPIAYAGFHRDFLAGKVVVVGCPKFDDGELYIHRLADIFSQADVKSVTVVVMEVPCCQGLRWIVTEALKRSGMRIPAEKVVIGLDGAVRQRAPLGA